MKSNRKSKRNPLSDQQKKAAYLFMEAYSVQQIADTLGVHRCTVWRWRQRPDFVRLEQRIVDKYLAEKRRETVRALRNTPENRERQRRRANARRRLPRLARKLEEAGESGDMKEYQKAAAAYDKCFNQAYFDGKTASEYIEMALGQSRYSYTKKKARSPKKYVIEIL